MKKIIVFTEDEFNVLKSLISNINIDLHRLSNHMERNMRIEDMGLSTYGYSDLYMMIETQLNRISEAREILSNGK